MDTVVEIRMPQIEVNDEEVTLLSWHVSDGSQAVEGQPICEVETSKSVGDIPAPADGVVRQITRAGEVIRIGEVIGYIGASAEAIDRHLASQADKKAKEPTGSEEASAGATAGALELAKQHGIDIASVPATGKVRRADVERFIAQDKPAGTNEELPPALADKVSAEGELSDHQWAVTQHLGRTQAQLVSAQVFMDVYMDGAANWIESKRQAGMMTGPLPVFLHAAAAAVKTNDKLASFRIGRRIYKYHSIHIAFTSRSPDGRLFTPVVRDVDQRTLDELTSECSRLNMAIFRGTIKPGDLFGGCLTVSVLSDHPVLMHVGLQNAYQSAILTAGAIRDQVVMAEGGPVVRPMTTLCLSYDHGLMDGWEASECLAAAKSAIESIS